MKKTLMIVTLTPVTMTASVWMLLGAIHVYVQLDLKVNVVSVECETENVLIFSIFSISLYLRKRTLLHMWTMKTSSFKVFN